MNKISALDRNNLSGLKIEAVSLVNPNNFPGKLWQLVNDHGIGSISWDHSGKVIIIHQQRFIAEVLWSQTKQRNEYFKTKDFTSIVRQLNLYGFRKVHPNPDTLTREQPHCSSDALQLHYFYNPNFEQDKPELLVNLKRLTLRNKAKHNSGKRNNSSSQCAYNTMLKSPRKKTSAETEKGSLLQHNSNSSEQLTECARMPKSSQAFFYTDPSLRILYTNKFDSPCARPSSPAHVQQSVMPQHIPHRFYTQVYQSFTPGFLDSTAASYASCDCYPGYSVSYLHPVDQTPDWNAGVIPDSRKSDMSVNPNTLFKQADRLQAAAEVRKVADANA